MNFKNKPMPVKNNKIYAYAVALIGVIVVMFLIRMCSHPSPSPFQKDFSKAAGDTIDLAIELNPTIYYPNGDTITGRDYDVLKYMIDSLNAPIKIHPFVPIAHAIDYLDRGLYDVVVSALPLTASMKEKYLTTNPVYLDREILVQRIDSAGHPRITSQIQLGGDTVWISNTSAIGTRIANLAEEIGDTIYIQTASDLTSEHLLMLVSQGVIDLAVINERIAKSLQPDFENVDISTPISFTQFQSWMVGKGKDAIRDSLNVWIDKTNKELEPLPAVGN